MAQERNDAAACEQNGKEQYSTNSLMLSHIINNIVNLQKFHFCG